MSEFQFEIKISDSSDMAVECVQSGGYLRKWVKRVRIVFRCYQSECVNVMVILASCGSIFSG